MKFLINLSSLPLIVLPLALVLIGINIYFRLRIMRGFGDLNKKGVQLNPRDLLSEESRNSLINDRYPQYKEEINQLAHNMGLSFKLILSTFLVMIAVFLFTYFNKS